MGVTMGATGNLNVDVLLYFQRKIEFSRSPLANSRENCQAPVVESVDAADSKSVVGNNMGVQVPPGAPLY
jgi:hypothetical protein